jgi:hypothetical protein
MATWEVLDHRFHEYSGTVAECKGDGTAKAQLKRQNELVDKQLAEQQKIRDNITGNFQKYLTGSGEGFDPAQLAAMISQFQNQNDAAFNSAGQNVRAAIAARGGSDLPISGDAVRGLSGLEGARATSQAQGLTGIKLADLQQAITNKFNAGNLESGQAAQVGGNVGTFNAGANSALDQYVKAANTGFGSAFTNAFGGALGKGLGTATAAGIAG